jgi:hypothetical protein
VILAVKASLEIMLGLEPRSVNFGNAFRTKGATRVVKLVGRDAAETKVLSVTFKPLRAAKASGAAAAPVLVTQLTEATASGAVELSLAPDAPSGHFDGQLLVQTDHPEMPQLVAVVRGIVHGTVSFRPQRLIFNNIEQGVEQTQTLTLAGTADQPVDVVEVENDHPALTTAVSKVKGGLTEIAVTCNGKIERPQSARLTIRTSSPEDPRIVVPVLMYQMRIQAARPPAPRKSEPARR